MGNMWKSNLLTPLPSCHAKAVCHRFTRHCHRSLSDNPSLLSIIKRRTRHLLKKQDFVTRIERHRKVFIACKKLITAVNKFKQQLAKHRRNLIMCIAMVFTFDWCKERICIDELIR